MNMSLDLDLSLEETEIGNSSAAFSNKVSDFNSRSNSPQRTPVTYKSSKFRKMEKLTNMFNDEWESKVEMQKTKAMIKYNIILKHPDYFKSFNQVLPRQNNLTNLYTNNFFGRC